jgi:hypothetical protein
MAFAHRALPLRAEALMVLDELLEIVSTLQYGLPYVSRTTTYSGLLPMASRSWSWACK